MSLNVYNFKTQECGVITCYLGSFAYNPTNLKIDEECMY